jgi:hypothetical protein
MFGLTARDGAAVVALVVVAALAAAAGPTAAQSDAPAAVAISNVTASTETPTAGEGFSLRVTVSNYEGSRHDTSLEQLVVRAGGERRYVANELGRLAPGSQTTVTVPVTLDRAGQRTLQIQLYGSSDGGLVNTQTPFVVDVRNPQRPGLSVSVPDAVPGTTRTVNVTVANGGVRPIENIGVTVDSPDEAVEFDERTRVRGQMGAGETRSFQFPARATETGEYVVNVSLTYADDGRQRAVSRSFETRFGAPTNPGRVILSGVDATQRGGTVELSATASNVGGTEVGGVVVSVAPSAPDAVGRQTYFVGSVEASDFSTFTLQTTANERLETLPVEVTYVESDVERSFTTDVTVASAATPAPRQRGGGGPLSFGVFVLAVFGLGLAVVVGGVVYRRRG